MCHFQAQNVAFVLNKLFLVQTIIITFIYLLALFIVQNLKKFLQQIQSYEDAPFLSPKQSICPKLNFFGIKSLVSFSSIYWPLSLCKILKNSYNRPRDMRMHHFWAQNGPFPQMRFFSEYLLISLVPFIHSCLSTCQKSKSDINLLIKY